MIGLKRFYQRKRPPQVKTAKKKSAIRRNIVENLQKANIASKQAGAEAEQIMAELLQQYREGKLSESENAMFKNMLMLEKIEKALEKIPNELDKFEELTISDYKEHCTIDGINDLFAAKSHLERCVWIIAIIACFVLATFLCRYATDEWNESIETKTKNFRSDNLSYPDVIICPDLIYDEDQLNKLFIEVQDYIAEFYVNNSLPISNDCGSFLLTYYPSEFWDVDERGFDEIRGKNLTNRNILTKHMGIMNFCPEFVKEDFYFHHKCYRFNSAEIFPYPNKSSIGIVFPNNIIDDFVGEKGFWFSIVDKTKELNSTSSKNSENSSSQAIDDIYNSLDWVYLRPGVHTLSIDATRYLILRSSAESRCGDLDIISNYDNTQCIKQTCDTIKNMTECDRIFPIGTSSKVDNKYKMCMEMQNDFDKYHAECVKKCNKYCDFWTYSIFDVKSEYFNERMATDFLDIEESVLDNRFYIRLLYNRNRYGLSEQCYKITTTQFISNIGGTTGLCIGFSLMSICQILLYMTMVIVGRVKKNRRERNSQKVGHHDNP